MSERPDPSVFDEPAHEPNPQRYIRSDDLTAEPALTGSTGEADPRLAPGEEPALSGLLSIPSYGDVYEELRAATTAVEFRSAAVIAGSLAFASGLILVPVIAAASFLWGPLAAVALLAAPALALVERRPWQVSSAAVPIVIPLISTIPVWVMAVLLGRIEGVGRMAGLTFAVALTAAAGLLGVGLADIWRSAHRDHQPPRARHILPHAAAAGLTILLGMVIAVVLLF